MDGWVNVVVVQLDLRSVWTQVMMWKHSSVHPPSSRMKTRRKCLSCTQRNWFVSSSVWQVWFTSVTSATNTPSGEMNTITAETSQIKSCLLYLWTNTHTCRHVQFYFLRIGFEITLIETLFVQLKVLHKTETWTQWVFDRNINVE